MHFDEGYAASSPLGRLVPPITWFQRLVQPNYAVTVVAKTSHQSVAIYEGEQPPPPSTDSGPPDYWADGLRALNGSAFFTFHHAPELSKPISMSGQVMDVKHRSSARLGPMAVVSAEMDYTDESGRLLVRGTGSSFVYDIDGVPPTARPDAESPAASRAALSVTPSIRPADALREVYLRGATPLFWEDVEPGDELPPLLKGTLDHAEIACFSVAEGAHPRADELIRVARQTLWNGDPIHAGQIYRAVAADAEYGFGIQRHLDATTAEAEGMPAAYDIGSQRASWALQVVTNWMSDFGAVERFGVEFRSAVVVGDTVWCKGVVTAKDSSPNGAWVDLELWVENQRAERVSRGSARVKLPRRER
jgi:acyl dehydratase